MSKLRIIHDDLSLYGPFPDINSLQKLESARFIIFGGGLFINIDSLTSVTNLKHIHFEDLPNLTNMNGLRNASNLTSITLRNVPNFTNITYFNNYPMLDWLEIVNTPINNVMLIDNNILKLIIKNDFETDLNKFNIKNINSLSIQNHSVLTDLSALNSITNVVDKVYIQNRNYNSKMNANSYLCFNFGKIHAGFATIPLKSNYCNP